MRCPKCHYLSFEPEPRCKNCGYDLAVADSDLALKTAREFEGTPDDLELRPPARGRGADRHMPTPSLELVHSSVAVAEGGDRGWKEDWEERVFQIDRPGPETAASDDEPAASAGGSDAEAQAIAPALAPVIPIPVSVIGPVPVPSPMRMPEPIVEAASPAAVARAPHTTAELPLFVKTVAQRETMNAAQGTPRVRSAFARIQEAPDVEVPPFSEEPGAREETDVIMAPVASHPPLAVRRSAEELPRRRSRRDARPLGPLDRDLLEDLRRVEREEHARNHSEAYMRAASEEAAGEAASPKSRAGAAGVDVLFLGGISLAVLWATLRVSGSALGDLGIASVAPLVGFLLLIDASYLLMFTAAGGQTLGKMLTGIRVVADESGDEPATLTLRQVAWRTVVALASVITVGMAWLPALGESGRAVHDRIAHTRVVRA